MSSESVVRPNHSAVGRYCDFIATQVVLDGKLESDRNDIFS